MLTMKKNQVSDKRNVKLNEAISGMRTVKLYAWEHVIERNVEKIRSQEEEHLKGIAWYDAILSFITMSIPQLSIAATLMLYVHVRSRVCENNNITSHYHPSLNLSNTTIIHR